MSTHDTAPEIDLGPLSWVQGEIDHALSRSVEALAAFKAAPADRTLLRQARAHVHQAAGAIQMVGLDAVAAYTDELERQFARIESASVEDARHGCELIDRACRKLKIYLDELVGGAASVPLRLFPEYEMMQKARGIAATSPTDLFYPDLSPRAPKLAHAQTLPAGRVPSFLLKQRRQYQRGLLAWLRGDEAGAAIMREAVQGIEDVQTQSAQRSFWWGVGALLESIVERGVETSFGVKQLCGRIDLQIRRFVEGSAKIADRMRREVLYYVAISAPVGPQVQAVQRTYRLTELIPSAEVLSADVVCVQPLLREAREHILAAKELWLKLTSGRAEMQPRLKETLSGLRDTAAGIGNHALSNLVGALAHRVDSLGTTSIADALAMEYATALLLAESAVDNFSSLSAEFPAQVEAMVERLDAAQAKRPVAEAHSAPVLDEMARRAQERLLLAHVAREIQANLRHIEQVLDAFFRDQGRRAELATLAADSGQIAGALKMLGLADALRLLELCQAQIDDYAKPETPVANEDLELLAEALSGLGFYIEAVEQQRPDRERLIAPLLAKRLGREEKAVAEDVATVETDVADAKAALPSALASFKDAPDDPAARLALVSSLESLRSDSELLDDTALEDAADHALSLLSHRGGANLAAVDDAIAAISGEQDVPAVPAPSEETKRLLETDASELDAELLDIFLTEAEEVLDTVDANRAALAANLEDRAALTTVRRAFHTLKGSGRMVGLTDLADLAFSVEKLHNRVLEEDRQASPMLLDLVDVAARDFRSWVGSLRRTARASLDEGPLLAAIAKVEAELGGNAPVLSGAASAASFSADELLPEIDAFAPPPIEVVEIDESPPKAANDEPGTSAEIIEFVPSTAFDTRPKSDGLGAVIDPASEADEIQIGEVVLSSALYRILSDEAAQHLGVLESGLAELHVDPAARPSQVMIRASHTLCGIHRTAGFPLVASTAKALEQGLLVLEQRTEPLSPEVHSVLARAVATLEALVSRVRDRAVFSSSDLVDANEVTAELDGLRVEAGSRAADTEAFAAAASLGPITTEPREPAAPWAIEPDLWQSGEAGSAEPSFETLEVEETGLGAAFDADAAEAAVRHAYASASDPLGAVADPFFGTPVEVETALPAAFAMMPPLHEPAPVHGQGEEAVVVSEQNAAPNMGYASTRADMLRADGSSSKPDRDRDDGARLSAVAGAAPASSDAAAADDRSAPAKAKVDSEAKTVPASSNVLSPRFGADHEVEMRAAQSRQAAALAELARLSALNPATAAAIPAGDPLAGIRDDVDAQLLPFFLEETAELFPQAGNTLRAWRKQRGDAELLRALQRTLHTLKGSARMAGAMRLGEIAHLMESRLTVNDAPVAASAELFEALETDLDHMTFVLEALQKGKVDVELPETAEVEPVAAGARSALAGPRHVAEVEPMAAPAPAEIDATQRAMLRVRADLVDRLVNEAGEVAITRARVEGELRTLKHNLLELTNSVIRLRTQVREIEIQAESQIQSHVQDAAEGFDPLEFDRFTRFQELTRSIAEGVNDVATVQQSLLKNLDDADAALLAQARLSREVQQQLFSIRTVPFATITERLYRILRRTAKELDKRANLEVKGAHVELDRSVLEKLVGPLEHLLRNALDHGIEARDARVRGGKPETGEITLEVRQQGNEIMIVLADDGAGLDLSRIREKAVAQDLLAANAEVSESRLFEMIFAPGFSTASTVTRVSGRGVGMDVVRNDIAALGGRVDVASRAGQGTTFTLFLPLTLAVAHAVLVRAGSRLWALPSPMVEQVQQVRDKDLIDLYLKREVEWQGRQYPFFYLPRLLGDTGHNPEASRYNHVILLKSGNSTAAIHIDEMAGNQEVVVKNIGPQLARVSGIAGATVLGSGEVVLIINAVQLAQRAKLVGEASMVLKRPQAGEAAKAAASAAESPLAMVVDDSLTVRKITSRLLAREGYEVVTAKDGLDALQVLGERVPDVILLDIEMPRMDGFEFTKNARSDPRTAHIPIVMISSRTADKHRKRAKELGVERYLGKPYQEDELLRSLREVLALNTA